MWMFCSNGYRRRDDACGVISEECIFCSNGLRRSADACVERVKRAEDDHGLVDLS